MENMDTRKEFEKFMGATDTIALATSVEDIPNVRFVNIIYFANEKFVYFQSKKGDRKEKEFEKNQNVAFITFPNSDSAYVRVCHGIVKKSKKTIFDVQDTFIEKMPFYKGLIERNGNSMDLYEIHFSTAEVYPNPDEFFILEL